MPSVMLEKVDDIVADWLDLDGSGPAGPLFSSRFTEFEITMTGGPYTSGQWTYCGPCTGSHPIECY